MRRRGPYGPWLFGLPDASAPCPEVNAVGTRLVGAGGEYTKEEEVELKWGEMEHTAVAFMFSEELGDQEGRLVVSRGPFASSE